MHPTGLMLAGELALAGVDVAIVERRPSQDLPGSRAGGLHSRTIEVLDQRGIADRFLAEGQVAQVARFAGVSLDISDFPTRHPYSLGLWQNHVERILAGWVGELAVTFYRGREVTDFAQDETGDLGAVADRHLKLADPTGKYPLDVVLPQPQPVVVPGGKVADVQADVDEPCDLGDLPLREEPIGDSTLVENLDGA